MNLHKVITQNKTVVEAFTLLGAVAGMFWFGYAVLMFAAQFQH